MADTSVEICGGSLRSVPAGTVSSAEVPWAVGVGLLEGCWFFVLDSTAAPPRDLLSSRSPIAGSPREGVAGVASVAFDLPLDSGFCSSEAFFEVEVSSRSGSIVGGAASYLSLSWLFETTSEGEIPTELYLIVILGSATIDECSLVKLRSDCASLASDKLWRWPLNVLKAALDRCSPWLACWAFLELKFVIGWTAIRGDV